MFVARSSWPVLQLRRLGSRDGVTDNERRLFRRSLLTSGPAGVLKQAISDRIKPCEGSSVLPGDPPVPRERRAHPAHAGIMARKHATECPAVPNGGADDADQRP